MTLAKVKAKTNETFIVQVSLTIVTYDCQNKFIVQAIGATYASIIYERSIAAQQWSV